MSLHVLVVVELFSVGVPVEEGDIVDRGLEQQTEQNQQAGHGEAGLEDKVILQGEVKICYSM